MYSPHFVITPQIAQLLIELATLKQEIQTLPIIPTVLLSLRESARFETIHYSTYIEGNRLTLEQVEDLLKMGSTFPGRTRDQEEILGYYAALEYSKAQTSQRHQLTTTDLQYIHALIMGKGKTADQITPTPWRDQQNAIYDSKTRQIVYLPPEASDVLPLMKDLADWINQSEQNATPCPIIAALAHYQYATIHPFLDGNGRSARILASIILARGGYDLKGIYSLEEYYAKDLPAYYEAISIGPSHNYYEGREQAEVTPWLSYFLKGMLSSFENVKTHALMAYHKNQADKSAILRTLDSQQQAALKLFNKSKIITARDIETLFNLGPRTARALCQKWVQNGFIEIHNTAKKNRSYRLSAGLEKQLFKDDKNQTRN